MVNKIIQILGRKMFQKFSLKGKKFIQQLSVLSFMYDVTKFKRRLVI